MKSSRVNKWGFPKAISERGQSKRVILVVDNIITRVIRSIKKYIK